MASPPGRAAADAPRPSTYLWLWQRAERLPWLDPERYGVAFLAATLTLDSTRLRSEPRLQPMIVPERTSRIAVVRIETGSARPAHLGPAVRVRCRDHILRVARLPGLVAVQIDFDAALSQRSFYGELLRDLRAALPDSLRLSITALASWCEGDPWLRHISVDEVVPMLFRMGLDEEAIARRLAGGGDLRAPECADALGVSLDEVRRVPARRRLYVFSPRPWTRDDLRRLDAWLSR